MFEKFVIPHLREKNLTGQNFTKLRILRTAGITEGQIQELLKDILEKQKNPAIGFNPTDTEVHLRITGKGSNEKEVMDLIEDTEKKLRERLGDNIYGVDDGTLELSVAKLLWQKNLTISIAESCTGGLIAHRLTNISGSSLYFHSCIVSYSNESKISMLKVKPKSLIDFGAVSENVAIEMAKGIKKRTGTDIGLSTTGIAGPTGQTEQKPVGLVYIGLVYKDIVECKKYILSGTREVIKLRCSQLALDMLRRRLLKDAK